MENTIPKEAFNFLDKLQKNNNREWFNDNKAEFKEVEKKVKGFLNSLLEDIQQHDSIEKLKVFRIYRDVRFSKNKDPYKNNFGGAFMRTKPELRGSYYLHIQKDNSFIATGFWAPEKEDLLRIRKEFETDAEEMRAILSDEKIKTIWGELEGDELKTAPKGFNKAHPDIDLIRKKQFVFTKQFSDKEVNSEDFKEKVNEAFIAIRPFFDYMSDVLTTDINGESLL
ncbi:DUF2461 domain-containing protein [Brumimicrobium aurantiacum]|uniref:DUF2461 domain-containing protein n=1 Tax=Brumimicrobium aurantiacum TaxID=1737063 RepID=A0A3E1EUK8_9FLAO|nr:DUF2461 domain-containing protein [Brumimicrobium aurantiacum]RFC53256.1 DUF2461 domain-containing protein [Brumimicrobium aurantiacum]